MEGLRIRRMTEPAYTISSAGAFDQGGGGGVALGWWVGRVEKKKVNMKNLLKKIIGAD